MVFYIDKCVDNDVVCSKVSKLLSGIINNVVNVLF